MAIIQSGADTTVLTVDSTSKAARIAARPMDVGASGGAYSLGVVSGIMAAGIAANGEIFQMRWTSATKVMIVRSISIGAGPGTTAFTAGVMELHLMAARSWSADGTGGTPVVFSTANTNKKRTDFALSAFSDTGVRFGATGVVTVGTKTLDTNKLSSLTGYVSSVATTAHSGLFIPNGTFFWQRNTSDEYPLLFEQNEGLVVRVGVMPATGTWQYSINVEWAEVATSEVTGW